MKVLVIGSGGREHAIVKACLASPKVESVIAAPGNGGMEQEVPCYQVHAQDIEGLVALAKDQSVDFVIVGPEVPLSLGIVDELEKIGIVAYGPNRKAAQFEASKAFTKAFLKKYGIPTAKSETFTSSQKALEFLKTQQCPTVIKASGLAAGKGVIIAQNQKEAEEAVKDLMEEGALGESGKEIVIEEFMSGQEASIMAIVSGKDYALLPVSQDHKQIGEGDTGPNTGGMGAYAPASLVDNKLMPQIKQTIIQSTLDGMLREGIDFRGTLYIGLMLTNEGPKVLEFNVRLGDPECQVLLPLVSVDPIELFYSCARGQLNYKEEVPVKKGYAMTVVMVAGGYPGSYQKGDKITVPSLGFDGVTLIHAGTKMNDGELVTSGGRVLNVVAHASTLREASEKAYACCEQIQFNGAYYRKDIGAKQLNATSSSVTSG